MGEIITKREVIASFVIIAFMMIVGFFISDNITDWQNEQNAKYQKALHIENNKDMFQYGMDTNIGNAFVYGELKAVDPVTYDEIDGEYMYVKKVKEKYTMHTRRVSHTRKVGKTTQTYYTTETYWTWDWAGSEDKKCKNINFCGVTFDSNKIDMPSQHLIDTIKESSHIRYKYYGVSTSHTGTIFTKLADESISDNTKFYENESIDDVLKDKTTGGWNIIFWVVWIILTGILVFGFYYLDNLWLNS